MGAKRQALEAILVKKADTAPGGQPIMLSGGQSDLATPSVVNKTRDIQY
jgi:hypothetical protein